MSSLMLIRDTASIYLTSVLWMIKNIVSLERGPQNDRGSHFILGSCVPFWLTRYALAREPKMKRDPFHFEEPFQWKFAYKPTQANMNKSQGGAPSTTFPDGTWLMIGSRLIVPFLSFFEWGLSESMSWKLLIFQRYPSIRSQILSHIPL